MERKRLSIVFFCLLLVVVLALAGCGGNGEGGNGEGGNGEGGNGDDKVYEIRFQLSHPRVQFLTQEAHIPFAEELEELSNGRIKVVIYDNNALTTDPADGVAKGLLEMAQSGHGSFPGRWPLTDGIRMPFLLPSATIGSLVSWYLYENYEPYSAQYDDKVVVLSQFASATGQLHTKKPVRTLEDLQGMKIGGWDPISLSIIEGLGGIPIPDTGSESAMNLDRGLMDGVMCPLAPVRGFGIAEIAKYHTVGDFYVGNFYTMLNKEFFDSLPQDLQELIVSHYGAKYAEACGLALDEGALIDTEWMLENVPGTEVIVLDEAELARWAATMDGVVEAFLTDMEQYNLREAAEEMLPLIEQERDRLIAEGKFVADYNVFKK